MAGQFSDGLSTLPVLSREVHALHSISGWQDTGTCPHQDNPNLHFLQALNEEIVNRKKNVDQAIRNGQALLKQTTGNTEEILAHWQMGGGLGIHPPHAFLWEVHALLGGGFSPSGLHFLLETLKVAGLHPALHPQTLQLRICLVPKSQPHSLGSGCFPLLLWGCSVLREAFLTAASC